MGNGGGGNGSNGTNHDVSTLLSAFCLFLGSQSYTSGMSLIPPLVTITSCLTFVLAGHLFSMVGLQMVLR